MAPGALGLHRPRSGASGNGTVRLRLVGLRGWRTRRLRDRTIGTQIGGAGGTTNPTGAGGTGGDSEASGSSGPGGGGAGTVGGAGGTALPATQPKGTGKGGTGGTHGGVLSSGPTQTYTGTDGGDGNAADLGSGGGGAGGYGLVLSGGTLPYIVGYDITGGKGGKGGDNKMYDTGSGGDGGIGLYINETGKYVNILKGVTIKGGAGGSSGIAGALNSNGIPLNGGKNGDNGAGGYGIYGSHLTVAFEDNATITGGLAGDGTTRAPAIYFADGSATDNTIVIGGSSPTLTGGVGLGANAAYSVSLAGAGSTFTLSNIATSGPLGNLSALDIDSTGTWTFVGNDGTSPGYGTATLSRGILQLGDANQAGVMNGGLKIGVGTTLTNGDAGGAVDSITFEAPGASGNPVGALLLNQRASGTALAVNGTLNLADSSGGAGKLTFNLGTPSPTAIITAGTLDTANGTVSSIKITDAGGLDEGTYLLISASALGTAVTSSSFALGSTPSGLTYALDFDASNKNLTLNVSDDGQYWNGTTVTGSGPIVGGTGTWRDQSQGDLIWSDKTGASHIVRDDTQTVAFSGTAGTVTVDTANGAVKAKGLKFFTSGYEITGDTLTLNNIKGTAPKMMSSAPPRRRQSLRCWPEHRGSTSSAMAR